MAVNHFAGMRTATTTERGNYMDPEHRYKLKIVRTFVKETRQKGDAFIAEFEVLETTSPNHKPGTKVTFYQGLTNKDVALGQLKLFTYAAMGLDPHKDKEKIAAEIDPVVEEALQEAVLKNTMAGAVVNCQTSKKKGQDKIVQSPQGPQVVPGRLYTQHAFSPA